MDMDRPKLYLVPPPAPTDKNVLQFGRLWQRREGWRQVRPRTVDMLLRIVPTSAPAADK